MIEGKVVEMFFKNSRLYFVLDSGLIVEMTINGDGTGYGTKVGFEWKMN